MTDCAVIIVHPEISRKRLLGLTLLERTILTAHQAGIRRFIVTGGTHQPGGLPSPDQIRRLHQKGIDIQVESSDNHRNPIPENGSILLIQDNRVFSPATLSNLLEADIPNGGIRVAVDEDNDFSGIAVASPTVLSAMLDAMVGEAICPDMPLIRSMVPQNLFATQMVAPDQLVAIESKMDLRTARKMLLRSARKKEDGFMAKHFNRPISLATTRLLLAFNITPTQVTVANLVIGLLSGYFIGKGGHLNSFLGGFLFQCASIFDGCDGEIARLTFQSSEFGTKLDNICDILTLIIFLVNLPIGIYSTNQNPLYLYLGGLMLLAVASIYIQMRRFIKKTRLTASIVDIVQDIQDKDQQAQPSFLDRVAAKMAFIFRNDFIKMMIFLIAAFNGRIVILWALILLSPIESIYLNIYTRQKLRGR
jgi:phosphatidylglycerophosphate synthase